MLAFLNNLGLPELMVMVVIAALLFAKDGGSPSDGSAPGCLPCSRLPRVAPEPRLCKNAPDSSTLG